MIKICVINQEILKKHLLITMTEKDRTVVYHYRKPWNNYYDTGLMDYLQKQQREYFKTVSIKEMRQNLYYS